jgi:hypothetical protein
MPSVMPKAVATECVMTSLHFPLSSSGLTGRPSIPETPVLEPIGRGVLDAPLEAGHDSGGSGA